MIDTTAYQLINGRDWIAFEEVIEAIRLVEERNDTVASIDGSGELLSPRAYTGFLHQQLNITARAAMSFELLHNVNPKQWMALKAHAEAFRAYAKGVEELIQIGFDLKPIDPVAIKQSFRISNELELEKGPPYRGHAPWEAVFYPEVMALYAVIFGRPPRAVANDERNETAGATVQFVGYLIECVADRQMQAKGGETDKDLFSVWKTPSDLSARNHIAKWLKPQQGSDEEEPAWKDYARTYEILKKRATKSQET